MSFLTRNLKLSSQVQGNLTVFLKFIRGYLAFAVVSRLVRMTYNYIKVLNGVKRSGLPILWYSSVIAAEIPELIKNFQRFNEWRVDLFDRVSKKTGKKEMNIISMGTVWYPRATVMTRDPVVVKHILKDQFNTYIKAPETEEFLYDFVGAGIFNTNHGTFAEDKGENWAFQRRIASRIFTRNIFKGHAYDTIMKNCDKILSNLEDHLKTKQPGFFSLKSQVYSYTLDIIGDVGLGVDINCLSRTEESIFSKTFDEIGDLLMKRAISPFWQRLGKLYKSERELAKKIKMMDDYCYKVIEDRLKDKDIDKKGDILSLFIQADRSLSRKFLRDVVMSFLIAGRDTSSTTLSFAFYLLASNQEAQQILYEEIRSVLNVKDPKERITLDMLKSMPYLNGVVLESLRLYPAVSADSKVAAIDDVLPNGAKIMKGTKIQFEIYAMGQNEEFYPEPRRFKPERWVEAFKNKSDPLGFDQYEFPNFQGGPRICLGKDLSIFETKVLIVELFRHFRFEYAGEDHEYMYGKSLTTYFKGELDMNLYRREAGAELP